jgi:hypothetical protein
MFSPGWPRTLILLLSTFQVAKITGLSYCTQSLTLILMFHLKLFNRAAFLSVFIKYQKCNSFSSSVGKALQSLQLTCLTHQVCKLLEGLFIFACSVPAWGGRHLTKVSEWLNGSVCCQWELHHLFLMCNSFISVTWDSSAFAFYEGHSFPRMYFYH